MKKKNHIFLILIALLFIFVSCTERVERTAEGRLDYSALLRIHKTDAYSLVEIINPWDTTKLLQKLVLTTDIKQPGLPTEGTKVKVPIERALIGTTIHCSLLKDLSCLNSIAAILDREYLCVPEVHEAIDRGEVTDCGTAMAPVIERIISVRPSAIFLSPYEKLELGKLSELNIPVVLCADYMESSPLARAEWIRFYGMLFGVEERADSIFSQTVKEYNRLKAIAEKATSSPKVLSDHAYGQTWYQPSAGSTVGRMYTDAKAENPFKDIPGHYGSIPLPAEEVFLKARDCDVWLLKDDKPISLDALASENKLYSLFAAYKNGNVWTCNTRETNFYEETPFHPEHLLADMIRIFHPELKIGGENRHFFRRQ